MHVAAHLCAVAVLAPFAQRRVTPRASRVRMGMLDDYDDALDKVYSGTAAPSVDPSVPSHLQLDLDEDGEAVLARFTYVDENTCIGCKNCALVARNTFLMEEELGKARVYAQGGDSEELIAEAIDSCPVNCIHYVSLEDLVTLETERGQKKVTINNYGDFKRAFTGGTFARAETKAAFYDNPKLGARCTNCPSRGCKDCPMFGVGSNPVYLNRVAEREAKRQQSGQAAEESVTKEREALVAGIWSAEYTVNAVLEPAAAAVREDAVSVTSGAEEPGFEEPSFSSGGAADPDKYTPATWNSTRVVGEDDSASAVSRMDILFSEAFEEDLFGDAGSEPEPEAAIAAAAVEALFRDGYAGMIDEGEG